MNRWHITVKEPDHDRFGRTVEHPYVRRFAFDTAQEALACYVNAMRARFEVRVNQVRKERDNGVQRVEVDHNGRS